MKLFIGDSDQTTGATTCLS